VPDQSDDSLGKGLAGHAGKIIISGVVGSAHRHPWEKAEAKLTQDAGVWLEGTELTADQREGGQDIGPREEFNKDM
jgi:hypothetical protein